MSMLARLGVDITPYARGLAQASVMTDRWATGVNKDISGKLGKALGAAAVAGTTFSFVKGFVDRVAALKDFSEQMNTTTDEAQQMELASKDVGLSLNDWGTALRNVTEFRRKAAQGDTEAIRLAMKYKLNLDDVTNAEKRNIDVVKQLGAAVRGMNLNARDRAELKEFFGGKAGEKFAAVLENMGKRRVLISPEEMRDIDKAVKDIEKLKLKGGAFMAPEVSRGSRMLTAMTEGNFKEAALNIPTVQGRLFEAWLRRKFGIKSDAGGAVMGQMPGRAEMMARGPGVRIAEDEAALKRETELAEAYTKLHEAMVKVRSGGGLRELRRQLNNALVEASEFGPGDKEGVMARTRAEALRAEIKERERALGGFRGDALTAMGNFLGDSGNASSAMARMESELRQIRENTGRMAIKGTAGGEFPDSAF